ncbi:hypothetical protein PV326_013014 [Microctonus aethiopoides]|nr:hypothetical protein PV326_013014 [Microctonus aethiopoides]
MPNMTMPQQYHLPPPGSHQHPPPSGHHPSGLSQAHPEGEVHLYKRNYKEASVEIPKLKKEIEELNGEFGQQASQENKKGNNSDGENKVLPDGHTQPSPTLKKEKEIKREKDVKKEGGIKPEHREQVASHRVNKDPCKVV